jgi:hypothetical protein
MHTVANTAITANRLAPTPAKASTYTVLMHALQQLDLAQASPGAKRLWGCRNLTITLFPHTETAYFRVEGDITTRSRVLNLLKTPNTAFRISPFGTTAADVDNDMPLSFKELKWYLAMNFSQGKLMPTISGDVSYSLPHWPNFGALGRSPAHLRICALLSERSATLQQIMERCHVEHDDVCSLLNGAALVGALSVHREAAKAAAPAKAAAQPARNRAPVVAAAPNAIARTSVLLGWINRLRTALLVLPAAK